MPGASSRGKAIDMQVNVDGLRELRAALRDIDKSFAKDLGQAGKKAADIVAQRARTKVPVKTGAARDSVRSTAGRGGSVVAGGAKAPYFGFLDFGNKVHHNRGVGRHDTHPRPFIKIGRYIYPALGEVRDEVVESYVDLVNELLGRAGLK